MSFGYLEFSDFHSGRWHCGGDYPKVHLTKVYHWGSGTEALVWVSNINIDDDGAPNAYGPPAMGPLDHLSNAGNTSQGWFGVASYSEAERDEINARFAREGKTDRILLDTGPGLGLRTRLSGRRLTVGGKRQTVEPQVRYPVVQQAINGDPMPGFYVSSTPRPTGPEYKQTSYVDATKKPFGALSGMLRKKGGLVLGDYGLAIRLGDPTGLSKTCGYSYEDSGGENSWAVGECSRKVFTELGGTGRNNEFVNAFIVFPHSKRQDGDVKEGIRPLLRMLSIAENADDLPLLMAFCAKAGKGGSGYQLWKAWRSTPDGRNYPPRPPNYLNVINGLRDGGFLGYPRM